MYPMTEGCLEMALGVAVTHLWLTAEVTHRQHKQGQIHALLAVATFLLPWNCCMATTMSRLPCVSMILHASSHVIMVVHCDRVLTIGASLLGLGGLGIWNPEPSMCCC